MLAYFFSHCNVDSDWVEKIKRLIKNYPQINLSEMGFPQNWEQRPIWQKIVLK